MSSGNMNPVSLGLILGPGIGIVVGVIISQVAGHLNLWLALGIAFGTGAGLVIGSFLETRRTRNNRKE